MTLPKKTTRRDAIPEGYDGSTALPNARWELFCQNFTGEHCRNASASYRAAGYHAAGDNAYTACAAKLLINANVKKRIQFLNDQALEAVRLHARYAHERLAVIATARYTDFLGANGEVDMAKVRDPRLSQAVEYCIPTYDREGGFTGYRLKLFDPMKALEMLGLSEERKEQVQSSNNTLIINA